MSRFNPSAAHWRGKKIWIVGASTGIGKAMAEKLASMGAHLALSARKEPELRALLASFPAGEHHLLPLDVADAAALDAATKTLADKWGRIDAVMFGAGIYTPQRGYDFDLAKAQNTIAVNLGGALNLIHAVMPQLVKQKSGQLILTASVAGYTGLPNGLAYGASKAGLINLAEALYADLTPLGIDVRVVNPGFVKTPLTDVNTFAMPFIITAEEAADRILCALEKPGFDINFPKRFSGFLRFLRILPYCLVFPITMRLIREK